jgi:hypothetical protein
VVAVNTRADVICRLEQFASGAVFCQMLDAYFKDAIPMHKARYRLRDLSMLSCASPTGFLCCAGQHSRQQAACQQCVTASLRSHP